MTTIPPPTDSAIDWAGWLERWDAQQAGYLPAREERFEAMFDALAALLPPAFVALDLACGPGSLGVRLLHRFPQARVVAIDNDPVLLTLGKQALGTVQGRLRWIEADLTSPGWVEAVGEAQVDAALSTTALHWLEPGELLRLYRTLGALIRPGGLFLNGDNMKAGERLAAFRQLDAWTRERIAAEAARRGSEGWDAWWEALRDEPGLDALFAERDRRFAKRLHEETAPIVDVHAAGLRDAGFAEVGVIWQHVGNRVLLAVR